MLRLGTSWNISRPCSFSTNPLSPPAANLFLHRVTSKASFGCVANIASKEPANFTTAPSTVLGVGRTEASFPMPFVPSNVFVPSSKARSP